MLYCICVIEQKADAIFRLLDALSLTKEGDAMNTMEVLTLLLVVFAALSYIDRHGDDNNKKK